MTAQLRPVKPAGGFSFDMYDPATAGETPFEFELTHPVTGEGVGVFISVISTQARSVLQYARAEGNALRLRNHALAKDGKEPPPLTIEEEEDRTLSLFAACIKAWRTGDEPVVRFSMDDPRECTHANALEWLTRFPWVRDQVIERATDVANFIRD